MTDSAKQTALFFGFVTAAMTYASAQATPVQPTPPNNAGATQETVVQNTDAERKRAARIERELKLRRPR